VVLLERIFRSWSFESQQRRCGEEPAPPLCILLGPNFSWPIFSGAVLARRRRDLKRGHVFCTWHNKKEQAFFTQTRKKEEGKPGAAAEHHGEELEMMNQKSSSPSNEKESTGLR